MALSRIIEAKASVFDWLIRGVVSVTCFLIVEMRSDVKKLLEVVPVMQEKIERLQNDNQRLNNKVFVYHLDPAKVEDEITFQNIIKYRQ